MSHFGYLWRFLAALVLLLGSLLIITPYSYFNLVRTILQLVQIVYACVIEPLTYNGS